MVFASLVFLYLFLPLNLLLYYATKNIAWRNCVLVVFSLFFYAWGEPVWVVLLLFSAFVDYCNGLVIRRYPHAWQAKAAVVCSLVVNLGLLVLFKYSGFLYENLNMLLGLSLTPPGFTLPIGISFYSFQTISYTVDVYRGEVEAQPNFGKLLLFVSLYHQLVAGPIVRYQHIAREIDHRTTELPDIWGGMSRFLVGLLKKVLIANSAGNLAAKYLDGSLEALSFYGAWFGLLMFTLQIYYDFSGYSDMAIGLGRMFGFHYYENFNYPYIAASATEFWRRWHISLGSFFRDYLYIPLGGRHHHPTRNLLIVWLLTGLWHGASWNFVLWGLYFGLLIALERRFLSAWLQRLPAAVGHIYLLLAAMLGWALFYFTDMNRLGAFLAVLLSPWAAVADPALTLTLWANCLWLAAAVAFCMPLLPWLQGYLRQLPGRLQAWGQLAVNLAMLLVSTALLVGQSYNPFLYFRF